jgi:uncharacterized protein (TIGR03435 family)
MLASKMMATISGIPRQRCPRVGPFPSGALALLWAIAIGTVHAPALRAQSQAAIGGPAFEVASVRSADRRTAAGPLKSEAGRDGGGPGFQVEPNRFSAASVNLFALIVKAYGLTACRPMGAFDCVLLSGGPDWLRKDSFHIQAKMPDGSPAYTLAQFQNGQAEQLQLMLQGLLADRFKLKIHRETKQLPVFALSTGNRGPKLKTAGESGQPMLVFRRADASKARGGTDAPEIMQLVVNNHSLQEIAGFLSIFMDRPVLDRTGLKGKYDFTLEYESNLEAPGAFSAATGPGMFRAFQEQAGLKLEATKGPVEVIVIDHAEHPSGN